MIKRCIITISFFVYSFSGQAQERPLPVNIQSPNAAGLGKYGDIPVSYFTGSPNISIPLYNISNRGIDLNLSLNYDASGVRIDQHPGCVGQNWSLSAGGVITRTVIGNNDELDFTNSNIFPNCNSCPTKVGYLYNYGSLNDVNTSTSTNLITLANNYVTSGIDYQPDIFTFNFMGMSGKFFLDNDGKWKVSSDNNVMVVFENNFVPPLFVHNPEDYPNNISYPKAFGGFKLIDGSGTTFVFGYDSTAIEYSIDFFQQYFPVDLSKIMWRANSWYLTKIIDKYQNEIYKFDYVRGSFIAEFYRTGSDKQWKLQGQSGIWKPVPGCSEGHSIGAENLNFEGNLISPVYLVKISMPSVNDANQVVLLNYSNTTELEYDPAILYPKYFNLADAFMKAGGLYPLYYLQISNPYIDANFGENYLKNLHWRKLDNIALYGNLNRNIILKYNNLPNERLFLTGLDITSGDWPYNPNYQKFSYSLSYIPGALPGYLSKMNDHWGFNNGTEYTIGSDFAGYYNQRQPKSTYLTRGMLYKITYPAGGYTQFLFEPHSYSQIVSDDRSGLILESGTAGGVRINKITDNDGISNIETSFKYVSNYTANHLSNISSGILTCKPKYYWPDWTVSDGTLGEYYSEAVFSINSMIPLANSFGTHIGYSEVAEIRNDTSYTLHKFSNYETMPEYKDNPPICGFHNIYSPYSYYIDKSLMRGKLLNMSTYNKDNTLLKEKIFTYRTDSSSMYSNYVLGANCSYSQLCLTMVPNPYYVGSAYKIYYFDYDQVKEETKDYLAGGTVSKITTYNKEDKPFTNLMGYSNLRLLKSTTNFLSDRNIITNYFYPTDLSTQTNVQSLIDKFRIDEPIKTIALSSGGTGTPNIGVNKTTFKISSGLVVKDKEYYSKTDESNLEQILSYDVYNSSGTLQQYTASNGIPVALLWDNTNNYLKAKIENATYTQVSPYNGQAMSSDSKILSDNIKSLVPNAISSTYSYSSFVGMTYQTDPTGISTKYTYDLFGRLARISDFKGNIIKEYYYHFSNQPTTITNYYNSVKTQNFYKQNCAANSTPVAYPYTVPANTYSSNISQDDANSQAQNDININGQNAANTNGICYFLDPNITTLTFSVTGSTQPVTVSSNASYTVTCSAAWITASPASITGNGTLNITCSANSGAPRNGTVTLLSTISTGSITRTITINQNGTFYNSLISQVFTKQNCAAGTTPGTYAYTVAANTYSSGISQADADAKAQNEINANGQNAANTNCLCYYLNPGSNSLSFPADNTQILAKTLMLIPPSAVQSVAVSSNASYTNTSMASWITITPASLTGDGTVNISCAINTGVARSSTVKLQSTPATGNITKLISIYQAAASSSGTFSANPTALSFLFIDAAKTISVTCSTSWSVSGTTGGFITATITNANTLSLKCSKNNGADRTGTVTITDGMIQIIINVTQYSSAGPPQ